ncbi:TPA: hypothetical protein ACNMPR_002130 [Klebsiella pneumoniae]
MRENNDPKKFEKSKMDANEAKKATASSGVKAAAIAAEALSAGSLSITDVLASKLF